VIARSTAASAPPAAIASATACTAAAVRWTCRVGRSPTMTTTRVIPPTVAGLIPQISRSARSELPIRRLT
jgi:hypothetical protein